MSNDLLLTVAIPVVNGLVEVGKRAGLPNRYAPLVATGLGIAAGIGLNYPDQLGPVAVMEGIMIGLSAVGLYSGTRNFIGKNGKNNGNS